VSANRESDERRIALVQKVLRSTVADAEAEAIGLRARIAKTRTSVTMLLARIEDSDPNPACRAELTNLEQRLRLDERRFAQRCITARFYKG
jgi:formiminotetrahydrofolate cyclodeaminase